MLKTRDWSMMTTSVNDRVKSGNFRTQVNSDMHLQTVYIQIRRLLMSRLIGIFTVYLVYFFIPIYLMSKVT